MTNDDNGAVRAAMSAARVSGHDLVLLSLQAELLRQELARSQAAAEALVQRQIVAMPLTDDPDYRRHLIGDILAISTGMTALSVHVTEIMATIQRITPAQPAPTTA
jgi:hypothetical protein